MTLRALSSLPSLPDSPGARCLEILRRLRTEQDRQTERTPERDAPKPTGCDRSDESDQSSTESLRLDAITLRAVLGPRPKAAAEAALQAEVLTAIQQYRVEVATGVLGRGVLTVRGRALSDYLDLDTVARLLGARPSRGLR